jgi:hypothetical protein
MLFWEKEYKVAKRATFTERREMPTLPSGAGEWGRTIPFVIFQHF